MTNRIAQFKQWLLEKRAFRVKLFAKDPKQPPAPEEALDQLPGDLSHALIKAINNLPGPPCEREAVLEAVNEAIAQWRHRPQTLTNSIVVLSTPVTSVSRVLVNALSKDENLANGQKEYDDLLPVNLLVWVERPTEAASIQRQLQEKLGKPDQTPSDNQYRSSIRSNRSDQT